MGAIATAMVAIAVRRIKRLDMADRGRMLDEVVTSRPEPTGFVMALSRIGPPKAEQGQVLHVLVVIAECFRRKGRKPLSQITKEMLEAVARKVIAMGKLRQHDTYSVSRRFSKSL